MSTRSLGTLTLDLLMKLGSFEQGMDQAARIAAKRTAEIRKGVRDAAIDIAGAIAAVDIGSRLEEQFEKAIERADELDKAAQKVGISVSALSSLKFAADMSGVQDFTAAMVKLNDSIVNAASNAKSDQALAFKALGINVQDATGKLKGSDTILRELVARFGETEDGAEKTAVAIALLGRDGAAMIPFLDQGAAGLANLEGQAKALGLTIEDKTSKAASGFRDQVTLLNQVALGFSTQVSANLLPVMTELGDRMVAFATDQRNAAEAAKVLEVAVKGLIDAGSGLVDFAKEIGHFYDWLHGNLTDADKVEAEVGRIRKALSLDPGFERFFFAAADYAQKSNEELETELRKKEELLTRMTGVESRSTVSLAEIQRQYAYLVSEQNKALAAGQTDVAAGYGQAAEAQRKEMEKLAATLGLVVEAATATGNAVDGAGKKASIYYSNLKAAAAGAQQSVLSVIKTEADASVQVAQDAQRVAEAALQTDFSKGLLAYSNYYGQLQQLEDDAYASIKAVREGEQKSLQSEIAKLQAEGKAAPQGQLQAVQNELKKVTSDMDKTTADHVARMQGYLRDLETAFRSVRAEIDPLGKAQDDYTKKLRDAEDAAANYRDQNGKLIISDEQLAAYKARLLVQYNAQTKAIRDQLAPGDALIKQLQDENQAIAAGIPLEQYRTRVRLEAQGVTADQIAQIEQLTQQQKLLNDLFGDHTDEIRNSISDALLRGFEDGKGYAKNFRDTLKNEFATLVLKVPIQLVMNPIAQGLNSIMSTAFGSLLGAGGGAAGAGGAGSLLGSGVAGGGLLGSLSGTAAGLQSLAAVYAAPVAAAIASAVGLYSVGHAFANNDSNLSPKTQGLLTLGTGGTFAGIGALDNLTGGSIFGTKWKVTSQQIAIDFVNGLADATLDTMQKKKHALFGGTSWQESIDQMTDLDASLSKSFTATFDAVTKGASSLGVAVGAFSFSVDESVKGLASADLQAKLEGILTDATNALVQQALPGVDQFQQTGESLYQTFVRLSSEAQAVKSAADALGLSLNATGVQLAGISDNVIALSGGLDQFSSNLNAYLQGFYSDAERTRILGDQLNKSLAAIGDSLPSSRDGFRALVSAIDLSTEAGQQAYATLLSLSGAVDQYYSALDTAAQAAQQAQQQRTDAANQAADQAAQAAQQRADFNKSIANQLAASGLSGIDLDLFNAKTQYEDELAQAKTLGASISQVEALYAKERLSITQKYAEQAADALRSAYNTQSAALQQTIDKFAGFSTALKAFRSQLDTGDLAQLTPQQQYDALKAQFQQTDALATAGDETALGQLQQISEDFLKASQAVNASGAGYFTDLEAVKQAIDLASGASDFEVGINQRQLNAMTDQVSKLIDINNSVQSVDDAIKALTALQSGVTGISVPAASVAVRAPAAASGNGLASAGTGNVVAAIAKLQASVDALNAPLNVTVVTPDGKQIKQETLKDLRERSRRGDVMVYASGVA